jgi:hypothetical protein
VTRRIDIAERRARLAVRQLLSAPAVRPEDVAQAVVALHATDPATVHLAVAARQAEPSTASVERALYEDRSLVRMLGMRRTVFVVPTDFVPVVQAGCTTDIAARQRKLLVQHLDTAEPGEITGDPGAWLREVEEGTFRALAARGTATAQQLSEDEPRLRTQIVMAAGKPYESRGNITSRVLFLLAADGRIVRGRPRGSWISSQYHWVTTESWLPGGFAELDAAAARIELARRYLATYGPVTFADLRWWTGWSAGQARKALAEIGPAEVDLAGGTGLVLADDLEPAGPAEVPDSAAALLPALDPAPMGYTERDWFLGEHRRALFDRTGNIGPTVWSGGRIVGGWGQRADGEIAVRLLEDVGSEAAAAVTAEADRWREWFGAARVTPRFRTPLERELVS